jgi:hypothetical protein
MDSNSVSQLQNSKSLVLYRVINLDSSGIISFIILGKLFINAKNLVIKAIVKSLSKLSIQINFLSQSKFSVGSISA